MRDRRNIRRSRWASAASAAGALIFGVWSRATRRPVDSFAILGAAAASVVIIVNALFLQAGSHPAPYFDNPRSPVQMSESNLPRHVEATVSTPPAAPSSQPAVARRDDPIADLIGPSPRIAAVQRVLSDYGYGQIKPSGILDDATSAAIVKFQREHNLAVTGEVSDRLVRDLADMTGHPLQ